VAAGALITAPGLSIDIEGYYKVLDDVAMFAPRLYPGVAPAATDRLFHQGTGTVFGGEVLLQHSFKFLALPPLFPAIVFTVASLFFAPFFPIVVAPISRTSYCH
jgi:hypothetical protein